MAGEKKKFGVLGKLLVAALGLVLLLALVVMIVPMFIDWNALKDKAADAGSKAMGRKLTIGKAGWELMSGVTVEDIKLDNGAGFSAQPMFQNKKATVGYSLLPLLSGKVVISKVEFDEPKILIEKGRDGKFNFSDLGGAKAAQAPAAATATAKAQGGGLKAMPVVVNSLKLVNAELVYRDLAAGKEYAVKGLNLTLSGFDLSGGGRSRFDLNMDVEVEGKKIPLTVWASFALDPAAGKVDIADAGATVPGVKVGAKGTVSKLNAAPEGDLNVAVTVEPAKVVDGALPPSMLKKLPAGFKASGQAALNVKVKGPLTDYLNLNVDGSLAFKDLGVAYGSYPAVEGMNGTLAFSTTRVALDPLDLKLGGQPVKIVLKVDGFTLKELMGPMAGWRANVTYAITSPKLVLDPLLGAAGGQQDQAAAAQAAAKADTAEPAPLELGRLVPMGLKVSGKIDVQAVQMMKFTTGRLLQTLELERQQAKVALDVEAYKGTVAARANVNLAPAGTKYGVAAQVKGVNFAQAVDDYIDSFPKKESLKALRGKVSGSLDLSLSGTGAGLNGKAITRNLNATGRFKLANCKLSKLDLQESLASVIPHPATAEALRKDIAFDRLETAFTVKGGRAAWQGLVMDSGADGRGGSLLVQSDGWYDLQTTGLDAKVTPHFNPSLVKLEGVAQDAFADDKGWATYDSIGYAGATLDKAKASFTEGVKKAATKLVNKKVEEAKSRAVQEAQKKAAEALQDKGGDLIKGLFGK